MIIDTQILAEDVGQLVSFPEVYLRLEQLLDNPSCGAQEVAQVISQDPSLSLKVLRIANSPFFGVSREVDTVARAVTVQGMQRVREAVLASAAGKVLTEIPNDLISIEDFWHHSIYCGLVARALASRSDLVTEDFAFIAGLLHDIGQLVLFNRYPGEMRVAIDLLADGDRELQMYTVEQKVLGTDHMAIGAALLHVWHLPERLQECVEFHHLPERAHRYPCETAVIHLANSLTHLAQSGSENLADAPPIDARTWQTVGLGPDIAPSVIDEARDGLEAAKAMLVMDGGS
jgi:putative nucleotidyltransferase with HDIG domain